MSEKGIFKLNKQSISDLNSKTKNVDRHTDLCMKTNQLNELRQEYFRNNQIKQGYFYNTDGRFNEHDDWFDIDQLEGNTNDYGSK